MNSTFHFSFILSGLFLPAALFAQDKKDEPKEPKPGEERVFDVGNGVKMKFCWIPGTNGKATLGSTLGSGAGGEGGYQTGKNEIEHQVELDGFWMAKTEMTQAQYMKLTGKKNPSYYCATGLGAGPIGKGSVKGMKTDDFPVDTVSWDEALECIKGMTLGLPTSSAKQGKRLALPSEAQWEWACRGGLGNAKAYYFGDSLSGDKANSGGGIYLKGTFLERTTKVGSYDSKAPHPWGLSDMHGNIEEWCEDYYGPYENLPTGKNPVQTVKQTDDKRVLRGGSQNLGSWLCRSASRSAAAPNYGFLKGFRVCIRLD